MQLFVIIALKKSGLKFRLSKYLVFLFLIGSSCSTEKNTFISRSFHNMTSNYNIYFNGYESFNRGIHKVEDSYQDNFSRILPVFYFSDNAVAQRVSSDMQRALEKATKVITLHSITAKPEIKKGPQSEKQKEFYNQKEFNKWIDDNYILMGKSYVYKREFYLALETFKKVIADFPNEDSYYEALIWMSRAYDELKEYRESAKILNNLMNDEEFPKKFREDLYTSFANHYIKQSQFDKAIPQLEKALDFTRKKHYKIRFTYILAQLNQIQKNSKATIKNYRKVIKMNPPYEMTFNAKINMASSFEAGSGQGKEFQSLLRKMLKDDKNIEYQDQIYYALGNIALKEGNNAGAIENFKLSAEKSVQNANQKGLSYLAIGDIYYSKPEYSFAQLYYDSSLQNIDQSYDYYKDLQNKARSLNNLVEHLDVFIFQDSLQRLAGMTEAERLVVVDKIIEEVAKKEEEERQRKQEEMQDLQYGMSMANQANQSLNSGSSEGKWYFYNMSAKGFGQPEFRMKWGTRKLEDDWRRKNKQSLDFINPEELEERADTVSEEPIQILSTKSREYYLKDIPLSDSAMQISHQLTEKALYNMGLVYMEELKDEKEAVSSYEEVLKRYPGNQFALLSAYNLYEYYNRNANTERKNYYKNYIINNFPDSPRAKILQDPEYVQSLLEEQNQANVFYEETYQYYNSGNYRKVIANAEYAFSQFKEDKTIPRFKLLRALSIGKMEGKNRLSDELQLIMDEYPFSEIGKYAREVQALIYAVAPEIAIADVQEAAEEIYTYSEDAVYYFAVSTSKPSDMNQLNFNLVNFNLDNFDRLNLGIQIEEMGTERIALVKSFENYENAKRYLDLLVSLPEAIYKDIDQEKTQVFLITEDNFNTLLEDADLRKYYLYYQKYYQP